MLHQANSDITRNNLEQELNTGSQIFMRLLESRHHQLKQASGALAADQNLHEILANRDRPTMEAMLRNHGKRIQASVVMLMDAQHRIIATTQSPLLQADILSQFPAARPPIEATPAFTVSGEKIYQWFSAPIMAPQLVGWLTTGFTMDDTLARELKNVTGIQLAFLSRQGNSDWCLHGNTVPGLSGRDIPPLPPQKPDLAKSQSTPWQITHGNETFLAITLPLLRQPIQNKEDIEVVAVLSKSLSKAMAPLQQLERAMIYLLLISILLTMLGVIYITRRMVGPINALAHLDNLTGMANRRLFSLSLERAIFDCDRSDVPFSVLQMDLDRFKAVNDTLGHDVGDQVLQRIAQRLKQTLRKTDTIARLGGDEFAVLLPGVGREMACVVAHKIIHALEEPLNISEQNVDVGISIGIAVAPDDGRDLRVLLRLADRAMYMAKYAKTGFAFYTPDADGFEPEELSLLGELRRAFANNELELHYQPIIRLEDMAPVGAEALLRWRRPGRGLVPPVEFIPFAQKTGFMRTLTRWILEEGLGECARWRDRGNPLYLSVNTTSHDLLDTTLPAYIESLLDKYSLDPQLLCIEITEHGFINYSPRGLDVMQAFAKIGVRLSVDDFGTGYSSLFYLRQLPIAQLKIDAMFSRGINTNKNDYAIVLSTVELGQRLGLTVVAEGIESRDVIESLKETGCELAQGYYCCPPMHPLDLQHWLMEKNKLVAQMPSSDDNPPGKKQVGLA